MVTRYKSNPIITPDSINSSEQALKVCATLNPGVTEFKGKKLLLVRVAEGYADNTQQTINVPLLKNGKIEMLTFDKSDSKFDFSDSRIIKGKQSFLTTMSYLLPATSQNGVDFQFHYENKICAKFAAEEFGIEDSRITKIGNTYYITFASGSRIGICTSLVSTKDFKNYKHMGVILPPDNKDVAIFPKKIKGKYYLIHRPSTSEFGQPEMWIASSKNLYDWGQHKHILSLREGMWDNSRIGSSSVPILIDEGWLVIYHGADKNNRYCLGAIILDKDDPSKVIMRSDQPFMVPTCEYETKGFFGNVIFSCGCILSNQQIQIYYGAADKYICLATISKNDLIKTLIRGN